jgi:hypothetical protein
MDIEALRIVFFELKLGMPGQPRPSFKLGEDLWLRALRSLDSSKVTVVQAATRANSYVRGWERDEDVPLFQYLWVDPYEYRLLGDYGWGEWKPTDLPSFGKRIGRWALGGEF